MSHPIAVSTSGALPGVAWTRTVAIASLLGMILLGLSWELWLAPTGRGTLALKVLPLLLPLPGLFRDRLYTYRWLSLMVWLYFTEGVVRATSDHGVGASLAIVELLLCLLLFAACAAHVRLRLASRVAPDGGPETDQAVARLSPISPPLSVSPVPPLSPPAPRAPPAPLGPVSPIAPVSAAATGPATRRMPNES